MRAVWMCLLSCIVVFGAPASARPWKPSDQALAGDYLAITDARSPHELLMVMWLAPPLLPQDAHVAAQVLDQYFVLGVVHQRSNPDGTVSFDSSETPSVAGIDDLPMKPVGNDALPPAVIGLLANMQATMGQSMGALGKGFQWNTFVNTVKACAKGHVSVTYSGETYTYETLVPGCPKA